MLHHRVSTRLMTPRFPCPVCLKFANPEFGLSPIVNTRDPEEEAAAAAGLRRLSTQTASDAAVAAEAAAEAAAQQPMAPGHQVVSVVCCSTEAPVPSAPAAAEKNQASQASLEEHCIHSLPLRAAVPLTPKYAKHGNLRPVVQEPAPKKSPQTQGKPQQQSGAGARLTNLLGRLKGSRSKASPPTAAQQDAKDGAAADAAAAAKPSSVDAPAEAAAQGPQSSNNQANGAASREENPNKSAEKGGQGRAFPFALPEIQKAPPSVAASSESKKGLEGLRGSRIRGLRRSQEGSVPNAAAAPEASNPRPFTAGSPPAAVATPVVTASPPPAEEAAADLVREQWASLPDAGASLMSLRAAVAEVESMQRALILRAGNSGGAQQRILEVS